MKEAAEEEKDVDSAPESSFRMLTGLPADAASPETGLTVGTLPSALGDAVVSVKPTATFEEAITLMTLYDFSQLPVLTSPHNLRGAVSWKSIARAWHADPDAPFSHAVVEPQVVRYDHDLIDVLPMLAESDFVLVKDQHNKIAGIVTAADVAQAYGDLASHFLMIGEMDRRLRQIIAGTFTLEEVSAFATRTESVSPPSAISRWATTSAYSKTRSAGSSWAGVSTGRRSSTGWRRSGRSATTSCTSTAATRCQRRTWIRSVISTSSCVITGSSRSRPYYGTAPDCGYG